MSTRFLKRAVGAAFLFALLVLVGKTCESESASTTLQFRVDDGASELRRIYVTLHAADDPDVIGYFEKVFEHGTRSDAGSWRLTTSAGDYRLEIEATTTAGTEVFERKVSLEDGARVTVPLSLEL